MNDEGDAPPVANGHSARSLVIRVLAAAVVVVLAVVVRDLVDDRSSSKTSGSRIVDFTARSKLLGGEQPVSVVIPPGAKQGPRSLVVFLHGRGEDETSYLVEPMFKALRRQKGRAPVVAFPRGGPDSYWHDREDGDWGSYVLDELIPQLVRRFDIKPERIGIGGISMGGFGAFNLARQRPDVFCTVGGHSPAVWRAGSDRAPGAFDNEADFERNNVIAAVGPPGSPLAGKRVWIDVGEDDPFADAARALADALESGGADVVFHTGEGGHETAYWEDNWRRYMTFYARALKACAKEARAEAAPGEPPREG